ncbi:hypothetical protein [Providencia rettgeri]|uniref:hypothetical protein n=1 Tax=Providencia rettgeri TaxID=587 RepID=UPI0039F56535
MMNTRNIIAFFSFFLIGNLYLDLTLYDIESFPLVIFLLFLLNYSKVKLIQSITILVVIYILSSFFSGEIGVMESSFTSFIQLLTAIIVFISLFSYLEYVNKDDFNHIVFIVFCIVSFISIIQYLNIDSNFIEVIRKSIHPNIYDINDELIRDENITISGKARPVGMAKEPSYLSIFVVFCGYCILSLGKKYQKVIFLILFSFYFYSNTSPILALFFLIYGLHFYLKINGVNKKIIASLLLLLVFFVCFYILKLRFETAINRDLDWDFLYTSFQQGLITTESSLGIRLFNPFITMFNILLDNPLFGSGFSNLSYIQEHSNVLHFRPKNVLSNIIASGFIYIGIVGMILLSFSIKPHVKNVNLTTFVLFYLILSFTGGGFVTIRFWSILFLFLSVYILSNRPNHEEY